MSKSGGTEADHVSMIPCSGRLLITLYYYSWVHQHKEAGLKIKLSKIKTVATAPYSVTIMLWKETTLSLEKQSKNVGREMLFPWCPL